MCVCVCVCACEKEEERENGEEKKPFHTASSPFVCGCVFLAYALFGKGAKECVIVRVCQCVHASEKKKGNVCTCVCGVCEKNAFDFSSFLSLFLSLGFVSPSTSIQIQSQRA